MSSEQTVQQQARVRARQSRAKVRDGQVQRERRVARCVEQVAVALAERDAIATEYEQRAGKALRSMIDEESPTATESLAWCGVEGLTARETHRLMRYAVDQGEGDRLRVTAARMSGAGIVAQAVPGTVQRWRRTGSDYVKVSRPQRDGGGLAPL